MVLPLTVIAEEVATTVPEPLVESTLLGIPRFRLVVDAVEKKPSPEVERLVVEALVRVVLPVTFKVPPRIPLPVVVKFPTTVEEDWERKPPERLARPVMVEEPVEMKALEKLCSPVQILAPKPILLRRSPPSSARALRECG